MAEGRCEGDEQRGRWLSQGPLTLPSPQREREKRGERGGRHDRIRQSARCGRHQPPRVSQIDSHRWGRPRAGPNPFGPGETAAQRRPQCRHHRLRHAGPRPPGTGPQDQGHPVQGRLRHLAVDAEVRRRHHQERWTQAYAAGRLRRLPGDAGQGEGPAGRHRGHPRLDARRARHRVPEGRPARLLREGDVQRPGQGPRDGPGGTEDRRNSSRSATSGGPTRVYLHCHDKILGEAHLLGRIRAANGQWNRSIAVVGPARLAQELSRSKRPRSRSTATTRWTGSATGGGSRSSAAGRSSTWARTRSTSSAGSSAPGPQA